MREKKRQQQKSSEAALANPKFQAKKIDGHKKTHGVIGNRELAGGSFSISSCSRLASKSEGVEISEFERSPEIAENKANNQTIRIKSRFISEN